KKLQVYAINLLTKGVSHAYHESIEPWVYKATFSSSTIFSTAPDDCPWQPRDRWIPDEFGRELCPEQSTRSSDGVRRSCKPHYVPSPPDATHARGGNPERPHNTHGRAVSSSPQMQGYHKRAYRYGRFPFG